MLCLMRCNQQRLFLLDGEMNLLSLSSFVCSPAGWFASGFAFLRASTVSSLLHALRVLALSGMGVMALGPLAQAAVPPDQAELIMKKSGLWDQLASLLPQARIGFSAAFSLSETDPTTEEADRLNAALESAYSAERLRRLGLTRVSRALDAGQVAAMRRWFDSPLGRKVDEVERAAAITQTDLREVIKQGAGVVENVSAERRALLNRLLKETRSDEAMVEVAIHTIVATHKGVSASIPGSRLTNAEVQATLMKERAQMRKAYTELIVASFAQAYAALSDDELRRHVGFLASPVGRRHTQLAYRTLQAALADGEAAFVKEAPAALKAPAAHVPASAAVP
jgi:hypothetical protein